MQVIKDKMAEKAKRIIEYMDTIARLEELKAKLSEWPGKVIDKRFFEKYFAVNEFRTKYGIIPKRYEWSKHNHEIYLSQDCVLELQTREKTELMQTINERLDRIIGWKFKAQQDISTLSQIDVEKVIAELHEIYKKHNLSIIWRELLDEVKYYTE